MSPRWSRAWREWTRFAPCLRRATTPSARRRPSACARCCSRWSRTSASSCIKLAERTQALRFLVAGGAERMEMRATVRARSAGSLRAARQSPRRLAAQVGARGPFAARARARDVQVDRADAGRAPRRSRALHRVGHRAARSRARGGGAARRGHRPAEAHLQHLDQDAAQGRRHRHRSTTSARCASSSTTSRTAMRRSASSITCGRRCRASSTTTSRSRRRTITARCTPR